jgi:hypothetical protein
MKQVGATDHSVRYVSCFDVGAKSVHGFSEQSGFSGARLTGDYNEAFARFDAEPKSGPGVFKSVVGVIKLRVGRYFKWGFTEPKMRVVHCILWAHKIHNHKSLDAETSEFIIPMPITYNVYSVPKLLGEDHAIYSLLVSHRHDAHRHILTDHGAVNPVSVFVTFQDNHAIENPASMTSRQSRAEPLA